MILLNISSLCGEPMRDDNAKKLLFWNFFNFVTISTSRVGMCHAPLV